MAYEKRTARLGVAAAAALTAALFVAGCASAAADTAATSVNVAAGGTLTQADARQAFDAYVAASNTVTQTSNWKLALSIVTGAQRAIVSAAIDSHPVHIFASGSSGTGAYSSTLIIGVPLGLYQYGAPTFYLPEPSGYPRFFLADVTRKLPLKDFIPGDPTTSIGGAHLPVNGRVLMVFEQSAAAGPWQLASVSQLPAGVTLPALATDKDGYVPQVPLHAAGLLAQPYTTGPLQAAVVDDGPSSAAAAAVAPGPLTTGLYQAARARTANGLTVPAGDVYQWSMEGTPYPTFALRTATGGALVLYSMYLNTTVAVPGYINDANPITPGRPIPIPLSVLPLLSTGQKSPRVRLTTQDLFSFAAVDPTTTPAAKLTVLSIGGTLTYATTS